jgi:hypothetical protein
MTSWLLMFLAFHVRFTLLASESICVFLRARAHWGTLPNLQNVVSLQKKSFAVLVDQVA